VGFNLFHILRLYLAAVQVDVVHNSAMLVANPNIRRIRNPIFSNVLMNGMSKLICSPRVRVELELPRQQATKFKDLTVGEIQSWRLAVSVISVLVRHQEYNFPRLIIPHCSIIFKFGNDSQGIKKVFFSGT
jgi:hypothetical protein